MAWHGFGAHKNKPKTVKPLFYFLVFLLCTYSIHGQKVFAVDRDYKADIKVYVTDRDYKADLLVFKVGRDYKALGNKGLWFFADRDYKASSKVFFTDRDYKADLIVFMFDADHKAGWRNSAKSYLIHY